MFLPEVAHQDFTLREALEAADSGSINVCCEAHRTRIAFSGIANIPQTGNVVFASDSTHLKANIDDSQQEQPSDRDLSSSQKSRYRRF